jgi:hypothetical protein
MLSENYTALYDLFWSHLSFCNPDELEQAFYYPVVGVFSNQNILGSNLTAGDCFFIPAQITMLRAPTEKYMADILVSRDTLTTLSYFSGSLRRQGGSYLFSVSGTRRKEA